MSTAKVFMSGRSQAVRLPREFRFDTTEVYIRRTPEGVLLVPKCGQKLGDDLAQAFARIDAEFSDEPAVMIERPGQGVLERSLDALSLTEDEPPAAP
jgi:antitoxin VapB